MARSPAGAAWPEAGALLAALAGNWRLDRRIESPDPAQRGRFEGAARFAAAAGGLAYREEGLLHLGAGAFRAGLRYLFAARPQGFAVLFAEAPARVFQEVVLSRDAGGLLFGGAEHLCGADRYLGTYRFLPDGGFTVVQRVEGPRKAYRLESRYRRAEATPETAATSPAA